MAKNSSSFMNVVFSWIDGRKSPLRTIHLEVQ